VHLDSQRLPSFSYARQPRHDRSDAFEPYAPTLVAAARALERDAAARRLRRALSRASIARLSGEVSIGDEVQEGQSLCTIEAMKMENILRAEKKSIVTKIHVMVGDSLAVDAVIMEFE
jgi:biotin carboxyl carrier protein